MTTGQVLTEGEVFAEMQLSLGSIFSGYCSFSMFGVKKRKMVQRSAYLQAYDVLNNITKSPNVQIELKKTILENIPSDVRSFDEKSITDKLESITNHPEYHKLKKMLDEMDLLQRKKFLYKVINENHAEIITYHEIVSENMKGEKMIVLDQLLIQLISITTGLRDELKKKVVNFGKVAQLSRVFLIMIIMVYGFTSKKIGEEQLYDMIAEVSNIIPEDEIENAEQYLAALTN